MRYLISLTPVADEVNVPESDNAVVLTLDELSALLNAATVGVVGIEENVLRGAVEEALDVFDMAATAAQG